MVAGRAWMVVWALLLPGLGLAQAEAELGGELFAEHCANQYCHGAEGAEGAAPALAGRRLAYRRVAQPIIYGVPGTNMPGWRKVLTQQELNAVVEYVMNLQRAPGGEPRVATKASGPLPLKHPGRDLFFDPGRVGSCGSCHELAGLGVAIAAPIETVPPSAAELRAATAESVVTVITQSGGKFPGVAADPRRYFDLTPKLPVLRSFEKDQVKTEPSSDWSHAVAIERYNAVELATIWEYLLQANRLRGTELPED